MTPIIPIPITLTAVIMTLVVVILVLRPPLAEDNEASTPPPDNRPQSQRGVGSRSSRRETV
jgi:hypothetical protein